MKKSLLFFSVIFFILDLSYSQTALDNTKSQINTGARYVSGADGIIRMYVNVWGHVGGPGRILVNEGIDLAILFSLTGGPMKGANLKKIRVYHEYPDKDGKIVHIIDLTDFIKTGDRSKFIDIQPNDTFIIKQTAFSYLLSEMYTINTVMSIVNIYLNLSSILK